MAFSRENTSGSIKRFWRAADYGNGMSRWMYVTADTPAVVEVTGYFNDVVNEVNVGDEIVVFQVGALSATNNIQQELAEGITDMSRHLVVTNTGSVVDVTPDLEVATVTYTT